MAYDIYSTPIFVTYIKDHREHDKLVTCFTREFGKISALAMGVRKQGAKLKHMLTPFTPRTGSFVKGKNIWRIIDIYEREQESKLEKEHQMLFTRVLNLFDRLSGHDLPYPLLFDTFSSAWGFFEKEVLAESETQGAEILLVLDVLYHLGYLPEKAHAHAGSVLLSQILTPTWSKDRLAQVSGKERDLLVTINESIRASGL